MVWGDGGGGQWLVGMEWRSASLSVCLPVLIFPCTIKVQKCSSDTSSPGWSRKKGRRTVVGVVCGSYYGLIANRLWVAEQCHFQ